MYCNQWLIATGSFLGMELSKPIHWVKIFTSVNKAEEAIAIGKARTVYLKKYDLRIALARNANGWFACQDNCPHRGVSLATGWVNETNEIFCPLHEYAWSLQTGRETTNNRCGNVSLYPVNVTADGLFIGLTQI